jgi:peptidoglycan/LPS O-acetylase OafA/YrhL
MPVVVGCAWVSYRLFEKPVIEHMSIANVRIAKWAADHMRNDYRI